MSCHRGCFLRIAHPIKIRTFTHRKDLSICLKVDALAAISVLSILASQQQRCVFQVGSRAKFIVQFVLIKLRSRPYATAPTAKR